MRQEAVAGFLSVLGDATGHLSREEPLEAGERITISSQAGIVRSVEPLLRERELRLVVQLRPDDPGSAQGDR